MPALLAALLLGMTAAPVLAEQDQGQSSFKSEIKAAGHKAGQAFDDTGTTTSIKSKLLANKNTGGLAISVTTTNGVVTLSGVVKSDAEKAMAEQIARETTGVVDVHNELTVNPKA
jgi:osmotically-inducible protein OsmY